MTKTTDSNEYETSKYGSEESKGWQSTNLNQEKASLK
tara:strand:+ start:579 stop:689 length:111 start_codon:yes stop_codon:yes gene_type:complete